MLVSELIAMLEALRQEQGEVDVRVDLLDHYGEAVGYADPRLVATDRYDGFEGYVLEG